MQSHINQIKQSNTYSKANTLHALHAKIFTLAIVILFLITSYAFHTLFIKFLNYYMYI